MIDLKINRSEALPINIQLTKQLRYHIQSGRWKPGRKLPTVRELAAALDSTGSSQSRRHAPKIPDRRDRQRAGAKKNSSKKRIRFTARVSSSSGSIRR